MAENKVVKGEVLGVVSQPVASSAMAEALALAEADPPSEVELDVEIAGAAGAGEPTVEARAAGDAPGAAVTLHTRFAGFAALPHAVGEKRAGSEAAWGPAGARWRLWICAGGRTARDEGAVGAFVGLVKPYPPAGVRAHVALRLVNHAGGADRVHALPPGAVFGAHDPPRSTPSWGFDQFIARAEVLDEAKGWLKDGALVLEAHLRLDPPPRNVLMF